jgi:hypothetical protein
VENEATYTVKTYPGTATWTRREDGLYDCRFGALGGSGRRIDTAENIAELLLRVHANDICVAVHDLSLLGWLDVVENILKLAQENREVS